MEIRNDIPLEVCENMRKTKEKRMKKHKRYSMTDEEFSIWLEMLKLSREYFGDMYLNLKEFFYLLKDNSYYLLVVGDQTIKGVYIPVCDILIEMAESIGYKNCKKELFRVRRSTGHKMDLPEEIVVLRK